MMNNQINLVVMEEKPNFEDEEIKDDQYFS